MDKNDKIKVIKEYYKQVHGKQMTQQEIEKKRNMYSDWVIMDNEKINDYIQEIGSEVIDNVEHSTIELKQFPGQGVYELKKSIDIEASELSRILTGYECSSIINIGNKVYCVGYECEK